MPKIILNLLGLLAVLSACTVHLDESIFEKNGEKSFPPDTPTQTNTVVLTNSSSVYTNTLTNTLYSVQIVTNTRVVTNHIISYQTVTNTIHDTNTVVEIQVLTNQSVVTNTVYATQVVTNTLVITNVQHTVVTNTILSNVDHTISVLLDQPADLAYLADSFTVSGYSPDAQGLAGAMIYLESTNNVMVQAQYSAFSGNSFTTTLVVNKEGHYYVWASAWDHGDSIGKSEKRYIIADWSAPQLTITTPGGMTIEGGQLLLQGTAFDRISGVQGVYLSIDGGSFIAVNGKEAWDYNLSLGSGTHQLSVYCRDKAGYVSLTQTIGVTVL